IRPPGTFSRKREKGFLPNSRREGRDPALLLRSGRRWREAPDEGASEASLLLGFGKDQKHASLRSRPLIRPPGTFSRKREKGFLPNSRRQVRDQPFSCEAGEGGAQRRMRVRAERAALALPRQHQKHASLRSRPLIRPPGTFSRKREKGFLRPMSRREGRDQPFSCAAGEGGAKRRMRARAQRAAVALPGNIKSTLRCARAPHPPFGHLLP